MHCNQKTGYKPKNTNMSRHEGQMVMKLCILQLLSILLSTKHIRRRHLDESKDYKQKGCVCKLSWRSGGWHKQRGLLATYNGSVYIR